MISFVSLALAVLAPIPEAVTTRVRDAIAATWRVAPSTVTITWGPIAPTAALSDSASFRLFGDGRGGRFVVALRTPDRREVAVTLRAGRADSVWVASRPLAAGALVRSTDAVRAAQVVFGPPLEAGSPVGWEVRRTVAAGEPLIAPVVLEPVLIAPGDPVQFAWADGPIRIVREGIAQTRARRGQPVWARDAARGEQLRGIATGPGRARLVVGGTVR